MALLKFGTQSLSTQKYLKRFSTTVENQDQSSFSEKLICHNANTLKFTMLNYQQNFATKDM